MNGPFVPAGTRHTRRLDPDDWWACAHPERPFDGGRTWIEYECRSCAVVLHAAASLAPNAAIAQRYEGGGLAWKGTLAEAYETYRRPFPDLPDLRRGHALSGE